MALLDGSVQVIGRRTMNGLTPDEPPPPPPTPVAPPQIHIGPAPIPFDQSGPSQPIDPYRFNVEHGAPNPNLVGPGYIDLVHGNDYQPVEPPQPWAFLPPRPIPSHVLPSPSFDRSRDMGEWAHTVSTGNGATLTRGRDFSRGNSDAPLLKYPKGMIESGNIDLGHRPVAHNADGTYSTIRSMSFSDEPGREILIPTVVNGKVVSDKEAIQHYYDTGENLGIFRTPEDADAFGQYLHEQGAIIEDTKKLKKQISFAQQVAQPFNDINHLGVVSGEQRQANIPVSQMTPEQRAALLAQTEQRYQQQQAAQGYSTDVRGGVAPAPGLATGITRGLGGAGNQSEQALRSVGINTPWGGVNLGQAVGALPEHVGPVPVQGPVQAATSFVGQSLPYAAAAAVAPESVANAAFGALAGVQSGQVLDAYQHGQISGVDALKQLAMTVGPIFAPVLLPALVDGAKAAGMAVSDFIKTPEGQALVQKLQSERGGSAGGEPPTSDFDSYMARLEQRGGGDLRPVTNAQASRASAAEPSGLKNSELLAAHNRAANLYGKAADQLDRFSDELTPEESAQLSHQESFFASEMDRLSAEITRRKQAGSWVEPPARQYGERPESFKERFLKFVQDERGGSAGEPPVPGAGDVSRPAGADLPPPAESVGELPPHLQDAFARTQENVDARAPYEGATPSRQTVGEENIHRTADEVARDAQARGASPQMAQALTQVVQNIDHVTDGPDALLAAGHLKQRVAAALARTTGSIPGQVGKIADQLANLGFALTHDRTKLLQSTVPPMLHAIKEDLPNLTFIGQDASKWDAASSREAYVFEFPEEFQGLRPETQAAINAVKQATQSHFALLQAVDPTTAQSAKSYLTHVYEGDKTSPLITPMERQRGEVGIAQSRKYPDWRVAVDNGLTMQKMPLGQLIEYGIRRADQGVDDALFRKSVLSKFGTNDAKLAKQLGYEAVRNPILTRPEEGPWYVPKAINNFIDQRYRPPSGPLASARQVSGQLKGVLTFPLDIAGVTQRLREMAVMNPANLAAGLMHRAFTDVPEGALSRDAQFAVDGLPQGNAGSILSESGSGVMGRTMLGEKFSGLNRAPWQVLNYFRNVAHEGNLTIMKALGMDVSTDTARGMANRQASADIVRASAGASKGAQRLGRDALEKSGLLSQQNTRAYFAQLGALSQLLNPAATAGQRLLAAQGIASLSVGIWGIGSLINMKFGNGEPLKFPVSYDPDTRTFKYNPNWDMIRVGDTSTPMLPQAGLANAIAKSFAIIGTQAGNPQQNPADALGELAKANTQFGLSRLGPTTAGPAALLGFGYDSSGYPHFGSGMSAQDRLRAAIPLPISADKILTDPSVIKDPATLTAEQLAGTYPPKAANPVADLKQKLSDSSFKALMDRRATADKARADYIKKYGGTHAKDQAAGDYYDRQPAVKTYHSKINADESAYWHDPKNRALLKEIYDFNQNRKSGTPSVNIQITDEQVKKILGIR